MCFFLFTHCPYKLVSFSVNVSIGMKNVNTKMWYVGQNYASSNYDSEALLGDVPSCNFGLFMLARLIRL